AADRLLAADEEQQSPGRCRVLPGQRRELLLEVLEAEVDADPLGVVAEEPPHVVEPRRVGRVDDRVRRREELAHRWCLRIRSAVSTAQLSPACSSVAMI